MRKRRIAGLLILVISIPLASFAQTPPPLSPPAQSAPPWLTPAILLLSVLVSAVTLWFTLLASRADTFRNLRVAFTQLRKDLPPGYWSMTAMPCSTQFESMVKYWQLAFDEWFITQRLNPHIFGALWNTYYKEVIGFSCGSPVMVLALFKAAEGASGEPDRSFVKLMLSQDFTKPEVLEAAKSMATTHNIGVPTVGASS